MRGVRTAVSMVAMGLAMQIGGAVAADDRSCGAFEVYSTGENRQVSFVDNGPKGDSMGDQRIGVRTLVDKDGSPIGVMRWIVTVLDAAPEGKDKGIGVIRQHFLMPEGRVVVEQVYGAIADFSSTDKVTVKGGDLAVLGGTGAFETASGVMHKVRDPDGGFGMTYQFDLICD